jgi:hypothetical protein
LAHGDVDQIVVAALFDRVAVPVAGPGTPGSFYRSWRLVALAECGTHAVFAAAMDGITSGEQDLFRRLFPKLSVGMLVIADRNAFPPKPIDRHLIQPPPDQVIIHRA